MQVSIGLYSLSSPISIFLHGKCHTQILTGVPRAGASIRLISEWWGNRLFASFKRQHLESATGDYVQSCY